MGKTIPLHGCHHFPNDFIKLDLPHVRHTDHPGLTTKAGGELSTSKKTAIRQVLVLYSQAGPEISPRFTIAMGFPARHGATPIAGWFLLGKMTYETG